VKISQSNSKREVHAAGRSKACSGNDRPPWPISKEASDWLARIVIVGRSLHDVRRRPLSGGVIGLVPGAQGVGLLLRIEARFQLRLPLRGQCLKPGQCVAYRFSQRSRAQTGVARLLYGG